MTANTLGQRSRGAVPLKSVPATATRATTEPILKQPQAICHQNGVTSSEAAAVANINMDRVEMR